MSLCRSVQVGVFALHIILTYLYHIEYARYINHSKIYQECYKGPLKILGYRADPFLILIKLHRFWNLKYCIDVGVTSEDPERNDILRLEGMKSGKLILINT